MRSMVERARRSRGRLPANPLVQVQKRALAAPFPLHRASRGPPPPTGEELRGSPVASTSGRRLFLRFVPAAEGGEAVHAGAVGEGELGGLGVLGPPGPGDLRRVL